MKRNRPIVKGNDAKRFFLTSEKNELKVQLKVLKTKDEKVLKRISEIEAELEQLKK